MIPARLARPLALALALAAAVWIHFESLSAPFFTDDYLFLDQVRGRSFLAAITSPDPIGNYLRPVSRAAWFSILTGLSGESARVFHVANLVLFLGILVLLERVARRVLPGPAAIAGVAVLAVHHAADVPVLWASGSQDLLAVLGALAAIELHASGRRWLACAALALALLSKETVVLAPFAAVAIARAPRESWRAAATRAWPLFATFGAWAAVWFATLSRRPAMGHEASVKPAEAVTAFVHLFQTAIALEWPLAGLGAAFHSPPPFAVLAAIGAVAIAARAAGAPRKESAKDRAVSRRRAFVAAAVLALAGAVPVVAVAGIWSAYYYLFSMCGVALAAGALVAGRPWWIAMLPALLVGFTAENARRLPEFSTEGGAWTPHSHVNRHYLRRGMTLTSAYLADLRGARPELPHRSTLYFTGLPVSVGFQNADGPLVRWAYRDSSLRSYFLSQFRLEHAARGPTYFFEVRDRRLQEITGRDSLLRLGYSLLLGQPAPIARDLLRLAWNADPSADNTYLLAWAELASERADSALACFRRAGYELGSGPVTDIDQALRQVLQGDTVAAIRRMQGAVKVHVLNSGAHALLADLLLSKEDYRFGILEAFAALTLAPDEPTNWRRWGFILVDQQRYPAAVEALERYRTLAGPAAAGDGEVVDLLQRIQRVLPGGEVAQSNLRKVNR